MKKKKKKKTGERELNEDIKLNKIAHSILFYFMFILYCWVAQTYLYLCFILL
jgi:hypothetical protein